MRRRRDRFWTTIVLAIVLLSPFLFGRQAMAAQETNGRLHWVFLRPPEMVLPLGEEPALSPRAAERLLRNGHRPGSDRIDYDLDPQSLLPLTERGIEPRRISRWLHAASATLTAEQVRRLRADPRVIEVRPVARFVRSKNRPPAPSESAPARIGKAADENPRTTDPRSLTGADYDDSWEQLEMLGVPELHAQGYSGEGVMIAVFDTGFCKDHQALAGLDLVAERDYVGGDGNTQFDPDVDPPGTERLENHGTYTWSAIGGFAPGRHLSAAYRASYVLARTEDNFHEIHLEEDNYIAALEWADSLGVDLVSTSLGYLDFDDGSFYTLEDLDGETIPITLATDIAADRGILVITAMGNEGPDASTLIAPADGKHVLSIGAVNFWGEVVGFSSRGPTGDGRIKPDVLALGAQTHCAVPGGSGESYGRVNGTSLSTPLITGLTALLLEARSGWTPDSLIAALRRSGDRSDMPSNDHGWGIPDGLRALELPTDRLRVQQPVWTEETNGLPDGVIQYREAADLSLWIRNFGELASPTYTLTLTDRDEEIGIEQETSVLLPSIAPGDSLRSSTIARVRMADREGSGFAQFFVRFEEGENRFERKVYVSVEEASVPIAAAYPNPVRLGPIRLLPSDEEVKIFAVDGSLVRRLVPGFANSDYPSWDLRDEGGRDVPSGVYFAKQAGLPNQQIIVAR